MLWALCTNINRATRDTPLNLVYGVDVVLPSEIYLKLARVLILMQKIRHKQGSWTLIH
jgi:hypothetical protein